MSMTPIIVSGSTGKLDISIQLDPEFAKWGKKIERKLPGLLRKIAIAGQSFWKSEAGRRLKSSRTKYQEGIEQVSDNDSFTLSLVGKFPNMIESGSSDFDMKPGFLAKNTKPWEKKKRRRPRAIMAGRPWMGTPTVYRWIPLNVNHSVNGKATAFAMVTDMSNKASWHHPGLKAANIKEAVIKELDEKIIPKYLSELFK